MSAYVDRGSRAARRRARLRGRSGRAMTADCRYLSNVGSPDVVAMFIPPRIVRRRSFASPSNSRVGP